MQIGSPVGSHHQLHLHAESANRSRSGLSLGFRRGFSSETQRPDPKTTLCNSRQEYCYCTLEKYV